MSVFESVMRPLCLTCTSTPHRLRHQVGDVMGHFVAIPWGLPDPTSLVVVGAAAVLGAACRAPLTAIALMVEITRDTGLLVPLLSAIGVASLCTDYLEGIFSKRLEQVGRGGRGAAWRKRSSRYRTLPASPR